MFTGIVEAMGTVRMVKGGSGGQVFSVELGAVGEDVGIGDSIAINGVCLTVSALKGSIAEFDVSGETVAKSTLGQIKAGAAVNIERAMRADSRFGGHIVQGHVDGVAKISALKKKGDFWVMSFAMEPEMLKGMVSGGSVAVDGVSLTVAQVDEKNISVNIIPTTLKETTLGGTKVADLVNIEVDIIVKAVQGQLEKMLGGKEPLTVEKLKALGF
jgi:riboflavin synthase